jgi:pyruvate dehydrogenase E2 component (dihydrolipoamide acetyltransferase)
MAAEVVMPKLGMAMKEGIVSMWHKKAGDSVSRGEIIASINSEKIEMDIEAPADGALLEITVPEDQGVPPGTVICYIGKPNETIQIQKEQVVSQAEKEAASGVAVQEAPLKTENNAKKRELKASPVARKMAQAARLHLEDIQGTGPQGRITKEDVEQAIAAQSALQTNKKEQPISSYGQSEGAEKMPITGMRKVIAERMHASLQNSAQLTIHMKADVTDLKALQKQMSQAAQKLHDVKLTLTDFIARAVTLSLQKHKKMNSTYVQNEVHMYEHVHLGIAVALEKGLVVPVIKHAENCSVVTLSQSIKSIAERARKGEMGSEEMQGSTFTITNLGAYGVEHFTPILNAPETGILGVGAVKDVPVFKGEELQRRSILPLSLTFDHRILDGAPAADFLQSVKQYLEEPFTMLL